jgi:hypothetical protein
MLKKLCQCIGLASILLVMNYGDLLGGGYDARMHVPFALGGIIYAQLTDILLLGLLLFAILAPLSRTRFYPWVRLLIGIVVPPAILERLSPIFPFPLPTTLLLLFAVLWAAILLLFFFRIKRGYRILVRTGDFLGIFLAVFAFCTVIQLLYLLHWRPGPQQHTAPWATTPQPPRQHPLLVWVVFDELSYDQLFDHRSPTLALPNFDTLRSQSTVFANAQPIGEKTVQVIPSLLTGRVIDALNFTLDNRLLVHDTGTRGLHQLTPSQTLFADAQQQGWRTAAVGWYNPYCTLYAGTIDDCYWTNLDKLDGPMAQQASFWQNVWSPLKQAAKELVAPERARLDLCTYDVRQRYQTYTDLEQHTQQLLRTDQADFVFLHLPIPHSPNIWSRANNTFTQQCGSSYLDNLALADRELGNILTMLESSPRWKDTTLIVEGDHSWRTYLWDDQPAWTDEDDTASHSEPNSDFDPRPAVLLHQPGQTQPQRVTTAWTLINVHAVVEQILHNQPIRF